MRKYRIIITDEYGHFAAERFVDAQNMSEAKWAACDLAFDEFRIDNERQIQVHALVSERCQKAYENELIFDI